VIFRARMEFFALRNAAVFRHAGTPLHNFNTIIIPRGFDAGKYNVLKLFIVK